MAEADVRRSLRGLVLSAVDLKQLTGWPDPMVEDYLNIFRNLVEIANSLDETILDTEVAGVSLLNLQLPTRFVPEITVTSSDISTTGTQQIICTNTSRTTVTLNDCPDDREEVWIKQTGVSVEVNGNGKLIDGKTSKIIRRKYINLHLAYTVETDSWHIL